MLRWVSSDNHRRKDATNTSTEIAFASTSIQTRDVMGSSFSYAKIMTMPFFGAGVVDIPAGGFKRAKNSRKMQMIFFVHTGKVLVTVADLEFSISTGGAWQVPRGELFQFLMHQTCLDPVSQFSLSFLQVCSTANRASRQGSDGQESSPHFMTFA